MDINTTLTKVLFNQREHDLIHTSYDKELSFYSAVKSGDVEQVINSMSPLTSNGLGQLSTTPIRNLQYHLVVSIALITRFCIEGGLDQEVAYTLSDLFIQKVDKCMVEQEISDLHQTMVIEYTKRMSELTKSSVNSKPIDLCLDYISKHYHDPLTLKEIADYVGLNATYLSSLFKKEMGFTLTHYIQEKKIEAIMNMLKFSDYSYSDISNYFSFSSHSHFIYTYRKHTGMTPKQYRDKYHDTNWKKQKE